MSEQNKIRILIADPHELFRTGLRLLIDSKPGFEVAAECSTAAEALKSIDYCRPDVALLEIAFNQDDGPDVITSLAEKTKVVVLTACEESTIHERCLRSGANGLVSKNMSEGNLFDALKAVVDGEIWFDRAIMGRVLRELTRPNGNGLTEFEDARIEALSPRERDVVTLLAEGLKNRVIAERLFISETTVRHHMTSILSKLELSSRLELVVFAYKHGLAKVPGRSAVP